jgi:hypothetical protein
MKPFNLSQRITRTALVLKDFGAVGDNVTDDTAAVTAAINAAQAEMFTPAIYLGRGLYKVGALPNLTQEIQFIGDDPRSSALMISQPIQIKGVSQRTANVVFRNMTIGGFAMSAGFAVVIDWAQDIVFENVIFSNVWNGVSIRQAGGVRFEGCEFDPVRGTLGVDVSSYNGTRNGELDTTDVLVFEATIIQGSLPPVGGSSNAIMLRLDGRVHTVQCDGLRLLNAFKGLQTLNTQGLPSNVVPRFFVGSSLEVENMQAECLDLQACREFNPAYLFAAGSHTADGVILGAGVSEFAPVRCAISSHWLHGVNVNGAKSVRLIRPLIYNNSLVGVGLKDGVYVAGSGTVTIDGGLIGKDTTLPAYTEPQKCGVDLDAAFNGTLVMRGVDLRGNQSFALSDNGLTAAGSSVTNCPGYNPKGAAMQTLGASPYSYTAGLSPENIAIYGGAGVVSTLAGGTVIGNQSPCGFTLQPRQAVSIAYATVPLMAVNKA